jgi:hypothetical protein
MKFDVVEIGAIGVIVISLVAGAIMWWYAMM